MRQAFSDSLCLLALSSYSTLGLEPVSARNVFNGTATQSNPMRSLAVDCCFLLRTIGAVFSPPRRLRKPFDSALMDYRLWLTLERASIQPHVVFLQLSLNFFSVVELFGFISCLIFHVIGFYDDV